jgi:hypothetical protein
MKKASESRPFRFFSLFSPLPPDDDGRIARHGYAEHIAMPFKGQVARFPCPRAREELP